MMPVISTIYETQSQFDKVEEGHLNESLLYECANFPGNLFAIIMSRVGVVTPTNEAMPKSITVENLKSKSLTVL